MFCHCVRFFIICFSYILANLSFLGNNQLLFILFQLQFRFVVMGNMFCTELRIHRRFDLKGSSLGRSSENVKIDENTTLKDLDLNYCFYLEPSWRDALLK